MASYKQPPKTSEFPILDANGLYASSTRGDGNCLFNALSEQLFGHQDEHLALRDATITYMRANADFYRPYLIMNPVRRNPKRKTTASTTTSFDRTAYTEEELNKHFELHLQKMGQPGEWADNMEVSAFASALNVHVRLWQADFHYTISPSIYYVRDRENAGVDNRPTLNIAYHKWEHYSSVRNLNGPHTGLPNVTVEIKPSPSKKRSSVDREDEDLEVPRASKRRSPLPLFDSDSTPEGTESSSDESNSPPPSQVHKTRGEAELPEPFPKLKLILKLRCPPLPDSSPEAGVEAKVSGAKA